MAGRHRPEQDAAPAPTPARRRYTVPMVIAATAVLAVSMIRGGGPQGGPPQPAAVDAPSAASADPGPQYPGGGTAGDDTITAVSPLDPAPGPGPLAPLAYSPPTEVRIPELAVDAPLTTVGSDPDGGIGAPPPEYKNLAGWFTDAPSPGERGTAVIDGHVDNLQGPAVFYGLGSLHKGNHVEVSRADGSTAVFTVYGIEVFAKDAFPGERVYGETGGAELRVITCGGGFTKKTGYDSNVVVFARLSAVR